MLLRTLRKVKAMPPPMIISLTLSNMLLISWILSFTFALKYRQREAEHISIDKTHTYIEKKQDRCTFITEVVHSYNRMYDLGFYLILGWFNRPKPKYWVYYHIRQEKQSRARTSNLFYMNFMLINKSNKLYCSWLNQDLNISGLQGDTKTKNNLILN